MDQAKTCTATFARTHLLTIAIHPEVVDSGVITNRYGTGRVASVGQAGIDCGPDCAERFLEGARVTLEALPAQGSLFGQWGEECPNGVVTMGAEDVGQHQCHRHRAFQHAAIRFLAADFHTRCRTSGAHTGHPL